MEKKQALTYEEMEAEREEVSLPYIIFFVTPMPPPNSFSVGGLSGTAADAVSNLFERHVCIVSWKAFSVNVFVLLLGL